VNISGGKLEALPQAVAHAGLAFDGHALVLQVGHIAVHRALRHFQPLRQKRGSSQPPPRMSWTIWNRRSARRMNLRVLWGVGAHDTCAGSY